MAPQSIDKPAAVPEQESAANRTISASAKKVTAAKRKQAAASEQSASAAKRNRSPAPETKVPASKRNQSRGPAKKVSKRTPLPALGKEVSAATVKQRSAESPRKSARKRAGAGKRARKSTAKKATVPGGGRRAEHKAATRERIVHAALELFERNGFQETTTKAIAKRAGIAEGTVFNYFATKEDIALHFFELEVDHAIETVRSSVRLRKAPLEEKLFALVQSQIEYLAPYERFIGAALVQALRPTSALVSSPRSWALRARYLAFVQELIDEAGPRRPATALSWLAPQAFWLFYIALLLYWLNDTSPGKESTLAFLDRSLRIGVTLLRQEAR